MAREADGRARTGRRDRRHRAGRRGRGGDGGRPRTGRGGPPASTVFRAPRGPFRDAARLVDRRRGRAAHLEPLPLLSDRRANYPRTTLELFLVGRAPRIERCEGLRTLHMSTVSGKDRVFGHLNAIERPYRKTHGGAAVPFGILGAHGPVRPS